VKRFLGTVVFLAIGVGLIMFGVHHVSHPSARCGGQQMESSSICEHYTNGQSTGTTNAGQAAHGDVIAGYAAIVIGSLVALLGVGTAVVRG
jgi:phosphotransferase system  glucose/maltose/N-acetylglucosamine-specific IIC component